MAAIPDRERRWYFIRDVLLNSPSRKCQIEPERELSYRQQAATLIQEMGQRLQVNQLCINTAIVYMHRFYVFHSFSRFPINSIEAAALFLAAKVEEQPRKLEYVIKVHHACLHRGGPPLDTKSDAYLQQAQELVINESILLQTLGFEVAVDHPHTHVVKCTQMIRASKDLAQTSYFMATNSLHLTTFCLQYKPTVVACVCIYLVAKWSQWEIMKSSDGKDWWEYVDPTVTKDLLDELTNEFLRIFEACPSRLKRRILNEKIASQSRKPRPKEGSFESQHASTSKAVPSGGSISSIDSGLPGSGNSEGSLNTQEFTSASQNEMDNSNNELDSKISLHEVNMGLPTIEASMFSLDTEYMTGSTFNPSDYKHGLSGSQSDSEPGRSSDGQGHPVKKSLKEYREQKERERSKAAQLSQESSQQRPRPSTHTSQHLSSHKGNVNSPHMDQRHKDRQLAQKQPGSHGQPKNSGRPTDVQLNRDQRPHPQPRPHDSSSQPTHGATVSESRHPKSLDQHHKRDSERRQHMPPGKEPKRNGLEVKEHGANSRLPETLALVSKETTPSKQSVPVFQRLHHTDTAKLASEKVLSTESPGKSLPATVKPMKPEASISQRPDKPEKHRTRTPESHKSQKSQAQKVHRPEMSKVPSAEKQRTQPSVPPQLPPDVRRIETEKAELPKPIDLELPQPHKPERVLAQQSDGVKVHRTPPKKHLSKVQKSEDVHVQKPDVSKVPKSASGSTIRTGTHSEKAVETLKAKYDDAQQTTKPEASKVSEPELPKVSKAEATKASTPVGQTPKVSKPETPRVSKLETPKIPKPETSKVPKHETPKRSKPEISKPESSKPESSEVLRQEASKVLKPEVPKVAKPEAPKVPKPEAPKFPKPEGSKVLKLELHKMVRSEVPKLSKPEAPKLSKPEAPKLSEPEVPKLSKSEVPKHSKQETTKISNPEMPKFSKLDIPRVPKSETSKVSKPEAQKSQKTELPKIAKTETQTAQKREISSKHNHTSDGKDIEALQAQRLNVPPLAIVVNMEQQGSETKELQAGSDKSESAQAQEVAQSQPHRTETAKKQRKSEARPVTPKSQTPQKKVEKIDKQDKPLPKKPTNASQKPSAATEDATIKSRVPDVTPSSKPAGKKRSLTPPASKAEVPAPTKPGIVSSQTAETSKLKHSGGPNVQCPKKATVQKSVAVTPVKVATPKQSGSKPQKPDASKMQKSPATASTIEPKQPKTLEAKKAKTDAEEISGNVVWEPVKPVEVLKPAISDLGTDSDSVDADLDQLISKHMAEQSPLQGLVSPPILDLKSPSSQPDVTKCKVQKRERDESELPKSYREKSSHHHHKKKRSEEHRSRRSPHRHRRSREHRGAPPDPNDVPCAAEVGEDGHPHTSILTTSEGIKLKIKGLSNSMNSNNSRPGSPEPGRQTSSPGLVMKLSVPRKPTSRVNSDHYPEDESGSEVSSVSQHQRHQRGHHHRHRHKHHKHHKSGSHHRSEEGREGNRRKRSHSRSDSLSSGRDISPGISSPAKRRAHSREGRLHPASLLPNDQSLLALPMPPDPAMSSGFIGYDIHGSGSTELNTPS